MTPTPQAYSPRHHPAQSNLRLSRTRRPRTANPYDASNHATPPQQLQMPVTPLVDEGADHGDLEADDVDIDDEDDNDEEGAEHDGDIEFGEDSNDVEAEDDDEQDDEDVEEEGDVEEALGMPPFRIFNLGGQPITPVDRRSTWVRPYSRPIRVGNQEELMPRVVALQYANRFRRSTVPMEVDTPFNPAALGLKEIGNLASWTVSSCKPGCGVEALRDDDTNLFWQSDGPQPHHLNIHFSRLVSILSIRIFLDFRADESYTPTRITLLAGTGYHDLIPFSSLEFEKPIGWIDVPLDHVGGGKDGRTLRAFLVQVKIVENHQNGKDTHVRGLKVYARDERARGALGILPDGERRKSRAVVLKGESPNTEKVWLVEPDWMGEPELR
ncbi:Anaphase-promoting complex subunit [Lachnellula willkommii]|uniref:Anaphase-promoting complex subunit n=1 Tax=Lachnellula willkommii TaxID=215461 RepID=A0A559LYW9_9HELO|nr:Anaphase-promoting complex subunit [Lachnellula willkommii]